MNHIRHKSSSSADHQSVNSTESIVFHKNEVERVSKSTLTTKKSLTNTERPSLT